LYFKSKEFSIPPREVGLNFKNKKIYFFFFFSKQSNKATSFYRIPVYFFNDRAAAGRSGRSDYAAGGQ
jgi:hypothetical protein